mmetsp:Transcript_35435/g.52036  ORF Transcript_35435/g.52036 Transcript_35435/m.52036 type:complete len:128 (+) Transcript_35435:131-514(+)
MDPVDRDAVGIVSGGAPCDRFSFDASCRKLHFPTNLMCKSRTIKIESAERRELLSHVPVSCDGLDDIYGADVCEGAIEGMIEWLGRDKTIKYLCCDDCKVGNAEGRRDAGTELAAPFVSSQHVTFIE